MTSPRTIGNRLAPLRFVLFFLLLIAGVGIGLAFLPRAEAIMIGFDIATAAFLLSCIGLFGHEAGDMRKAARDNDANRVVLLVLTFVITLVILVTVAGELVGKDHPSLLEKLLIVATLVLAWVGANMVYALHYAHLFYTRDDGGKDRAGVVFPGDCKEPDYWDFVYFSFTIGVALQTSDVAITSPAIRRVAIGQSVAAFVYNLVVLALAVSVLASR